MRFIRSGRDVPPAPGHIPEESMISINALNAFFNEHLLKVEYFAFDAEQRLAALRMAENDIASELGRSPDETSYLELAAVGEQAVHLLRHGGNGENSALASERVEGVGSRTYMKTGVPAIAPRARRYLRALLGATVAVARG